MAITFDGPNREVVLDSGTTLYSAAEIYSRWKDWFHSGNSGIAPVAFRAIGGDDLGGGSFVPAFIFLRDDLGWSIREPEADIDITINGNLLPQTPGATIFQRPTGGFSPTVIVSRENVAVQDLSTIWTTILADYQGQPGTAGYIIDRLIRVALGDEEFNGSKAYIRDKDSKEVLVEKDVVTGSTDPVHLQEPTP